MFLGNLSVRCEARPGANIRECCQEAARLADSVRLPVEFEFNGVAMRIDPFCNSEGPPPGLREYGIAAEAISKRLKNEVLAASPDHPEMAVVISDDKIASFREPEAIFAFAEKTASDHLLPVYFTLRGKQVKILPLDPSSARLEAAKWDFGQLRSVLGSKAGK